MRRTYQAEESATESCDGGSCAIHWPHSRVSAPIPPPQQLWSSSLALPSSVWCPCRTLCSSTLLTNPSFFWWPWASASPSKKGKDGKCRHRERDLAAQPTVLLLAVPHRSILFRCRLCDLARQLSGADCSAASRARVGLVRVPRSVKAFQGQIDHPASPGPQCCHRATSIWRLFEYLRTRAAARGRHALASCRVGGTDDCDLRPRCRQEWC